jgi:hypothetical protein
MGLEAYARNILISNEGISGTPWNRDHVYGKKSTFNWMDSFTKSIQNLKRLHPEAVPIIFFRKHGDLLISMYKQYVQEGGILELNQFYGENEVIRDSDLSFEKRIGLLQHYFDQFYVLNFEQFKKEGDIYLDRFFGSLGIEGTSTGQKEKKQANVSISGKKIDLLRRINPYYNRVPVKARKAIRLLRLSPRDILQTKLSFWESPESEQLTKLKNEVNLKHNEDWKSIDKWFWNVNNDRELIELK